MGGGLFPTSFSQTPDDPELNSHDVVMLSFQAMDAKYDVPGAGSAFVCFRDLRITTSTS